MELDEEPIHQINQDALKMALELSQLLKLHVPSVLCVMRKTISDGSAISGFQRTVLVGLGDDQSFIETPRGRVRIKDLYLEEDSSKIISKTETESHYSLSRLGIPLIELSTQPDITDPEHAKETAQYLGMVFRSFPLTKRGLGTIRQDINLSINGGSRVEIKGFQDLRKMPQTIEYEIKRQLEIVQSGKKVQPEVRKAHPDGTTSFLRPMPGAARLYPETDASFIPITKELLSSLKIPELLAEKIIAVEKKYGLISDVAREVLDHPFFERFVKTFTLEPTFIAQVLIETPKEIATREKIDTTTLQEKDFYFVLENVQKNTIPRSAVSTILTQLAQGKHVDLNAFKSVSLDEVEAFIDHLMKTNKDVSMNGLMGDVMKKYKGKVDGKTVADLLKKKLR